MQDYICLLIVQNLLCVMRSQSNETTLFCFTFIKEFEKFFSNILQNNLYKLLKNCVQQNLAKVGGCMRSFNLCKVTCPFLKGQSHEIFGLWFFR
jgi:hypothetical protein